MPLEIVTVPCLSDNYAFLIHSRETGETALVDAPETAPIEAALTARGWNLSHILITHHHGDHIDGVEPLRASTGARVIGANADAARLPKLDAGFDDGDQFSFAGHPVHVLDVSGHTIGHIAFYLAAAGAVFTADSLMALGCGRVFEGTHAMMWDSLSKFMGLPDDMQVYSGHNYGKANGAFALSVDPDNQALKDRIAAIDAADAAGTPIVPSSMAEERATNPFLRAVSPDVKASVGLAGADDAATFAEVRRRKDNF